MRLSVFGKFDEPAIDKGEMVGIGYNPAVVASRPTTRLTLIWEFHCTLFDGNTPMRPSRLSHSFRGKEKKGPHSSLPSFTLSRI